MKSYNPHYSLKKLINEQHYTLKPITIHVMMFSVDSDCVQNAS